MTGNTAQETLWRATGHYQPALASKASLFEESRLFLFTYAQLRDIPATFQALVNKELPQHSYATRATIVTILGKRLTRWNPPTWVLDDLATFAQQPGEALRVALLLHTARQDHLLYDFVQEGLIPHWQAGFRQVLRSQVQSFLDTAQSAHPEIDHWSASTREKISGNVLTVLREGRLLKGTAQKSLIQPTVPIQVAHHLIRLLQAEGIPHGQLAEHPDWQLWLWTPAQARQALRSFLEQEQPA